MYYSKEELTTLLSDNGWDKQELVQPVEKTLVILNYTKINEIDIELRREYFTTLIIKKAVFYASGGELLLLNKTKNGGWIYGKTLPVTKPYPFFASVVDEEAANIIKILSGSGLDEKDVIIKKKNEGDELVRFFFKKKINVGDDEASKSFKFLSKKIQNTRNSYIFSVLNKRVKNIPMNAIMWKIGRDSDNKTWVAKNYANSLNELAQILSTFLVNRDDAIKMTIQTDDIEIDPRDFSLFSLTIIDDKTYSVIWKNGETETYRVRK